ncbi:Dam family site-specific DNA-(adenine-N6)-methyltransferase [Gammaproteobacteria bacterium]|nr:Dam family site-specific DNA-(adenine-N6)-methyltransferase [Gammaproteobacteria bacterium]
MNKIKPILKWAGGKSFLVPNINKIIENIKFKRYIEPFFGGGAIYFNLIKNNQNIIKNSIINDMNSDLMSLYKNIKTQSRSLIKSHGRIKNQFKAKGYYYIRARYNGVDENGIKVNRYENTDRSAALMILNKTCFNGIYRVNKDNKYNVPKGRYKSPAFIEDDLIISLSKILPKTINIKSISYQKIKYKKNDLVYFDPPYDPINKTSSFTSYSGKFGKDEQRELYDKFNKLDAMGANVILSNNNTDFIKDLYKEHNLETVECSRSINSKKDKRGKIQELIIVGKNFGK